MIDFLSILCFCLFLLFLTVTGVLYFRSFKEYLQRQVDGRRCGEDDVTTAVERGIESNPYADPCSPGAVGLKNASRSCPACGATTQDGVCENRLCSTWQLRSED